MPHSPASRKKFLDSAAEKFHHDLQEKLRNDQQKMQGFYNAVKRLKAESATPEVVVAKINTCMKKYPEFCNRVVGFHPDGSIKLRETEPLLMHGTPPPARFTSDTLLSIVACLPFPSIGRLARSCKWMNAHITEEQVERALKQGKERFGKVELLTAGGRQVLRLFSTNEEMIEISRLSNSSMIYVLKVKGRTFLGAATLESSIYPVYIDDNSESGGAAVLVPMPDIFGHVISSLGAADAQAPSVLWFKDVIRLSRNTITILFLKIGGDNHTNIRAAQCSMLFDEFVPC
jgi:hypothetical protein